MKVLDLEDLMHSAFTTEFLNFGFHDGKYLKEMAS